MNTLGAAARMLANFASTSLVYISIPASAAAEASSAVSTCIVNI
jgi:hypothetical protein